MKIMFLLWKIIIVVNVVFMFVDCQFDNQYLGHHFTREEYDNQKPACGTKVCLDDAQLLLLAATQNKTIEPCDDFDEFAMGRFIKLGAPNDRYQFLGFQSDLKLLEYERIRKLVAAKINKNDIRPFRIAKNYYQKCVNSDNIRMNATAEMLQYLKSLGGAPFLDSSWDEDNFKIEEIFEKEANLATKIFMIHEIRRCPHLSNKSLEVVCLEINHDDHLFDVGVDDFVQMYNKLKIDENLVRSTYQKLLQFRTSIRDLDLAQRGDYEFIKYFENKNDSILFTISSFNNYTNFKLNWLKILNSQLTKEEQLTDDSEILIDEPKLILKLLELIESIPKETLADFFVFIFPYDMKNQFIVYPFDTNDQSYKGTIKSGQRWEQCVENLLKYFGPALHGLHKVKYFKKEVQDSVHDLTKDVIKDYITFLNEIRFSDDAKKDVAQKLNTAKIQIGYPEEIFDLQKIEEFYKDLELDETEGIIKSYIKIREYSDNIENNPKSNWKKKLNRKFGNFHMEYDFDVNLIYMHPMFIQYPYYHPNRSHFFNTATLFRKIAGFLNWFIGEYLFTNWKSMSSINDGFSSETFAYNNYIKWEESGGKELQLPGFFLTNQQMYWVVIAHTTFSKSHPYKKYTVNVTQPGHSDLDLEYLKSFRKAFNCSELKKR